MGMLWPTLEFILGISMIITLLVGGHLVIEHRIDVGQFVAFNTYMIMLIWPIIAVGWVINIFQRGTASVKRVDELLKAEPAIDDSAADASIDADAVLSGDIEFRNLNFSYGDVPVLKDISLRIPAGSSLAIVGPTGCGKSTLVHLISRMYDAPDGALRIDGRPVRDYPLAVLRRNIGMVSQETFLFSETIRENLAFGVPHASAEDLLEAAEAAHIRQEFEEFPQGFQTMVGERGVTLSGGQKQRSAIARALLRRPAILILDDALASVDTYTEERILGGLRKYTANSTTVLSRTACPRCEMPTRSPCSITAESWSWAGTMNCLRSTDTTPASTRSSNSKKNSRWRAESGRLGVPAHAHRRLRGIVLRGKLRLPLKPRRRNDLQRRGIDHRILRHLTPGFTHVLDAVDSVVKLCPRS